MIALGIAIGISVQVFIGSLISGLQASLVNSTIGNASQVTVLSDTDEPFIRDYEALMQSLKASDSRITKVSAVIDQPGIIINGDESESILLRGLVFADADPIYNIEGRLIEGRLPQQDFEVVIGRELAAELGAVIGDRIEATVLSGIRQTFRLVGVFDLKVQTINNSWFLTTQNSVQTLFDKRNQITSIEMQVDPDAVFAADEISAGLTALNRNGELKITNWKAQNEQLLSGLNGQSVSSLMIQVFVVISVVLGIASVLAISVLQKSRQIGILKAMGIRNAQASRIFLYQGLILGVLGGLLGVALGYGLAFSFTKFAVRPDGSPVVALLIDPNFFALSFFIAVAASSAASLIPARRSSRLNPIEVIKNG
jgi:lipoprotein-releasing system permease protein